MGHKAFWLLEAWVSVSCIEYAIYIWFRHKGIKMPLVTKPGSRNTRARMEYVVQAFSSLEALGWSIQPCQGLLGLRQEEVERSDVPRGCKKWMASEDLTKRVVGTNVCVGFAQPARPPVAPSHLLMTLGDWMRCISCGPIRFHIWGSSPLRVKTELLFVPFLQTFQAIKWKISGGRKGTYYVTWEMQPVICFPQAEVDCLLVVYWTESMNVTVYPSLHSPTQCSFNKQSWKCLLYGINNGHHRHSISLFGIHLHTKFITSLGQGQGGEVRSQSHTGQTLVVRKKWVTHLGARPKPYVKLKFKSPTKRKRNKNNRCY